MNPAYIVDIVRTPIGRYGGGLADVRPDDLAAHVMRALLERQKNVNASDIEDVIFGAANQAGEDNRNVARMALLLANIPVTTAGITVNRLCASGLQSVMDAARCVMLGDGEVFIAGGVESMTRAPFVMTKSDQAWSRNSEMADTTIGWRFTNPLLSEKYYPFSMGETAENVADLYKIARIEQDNFALNSQKKYAEAFAQGKFNNEIVPVPVIRQRETSLFTKDEHPRETSLEKLALLRPAFREGGSVTAGNSSGINDGASACMVVSEEFIKQRNLKPMARIVSMAVSGVDPAVMGLGPIAATRKALKRAGLAIGNIGLIELNEAFAVQALACMRDLDVNPAIVNVNGGSIALGHPLGCSGTRISATLIHEMQKRQTRYGLATMCVGVGQGAAIIYERC